MIIPWAACSLIQRSLLSIGPIVNAPILAHTLLGARILGSDGRWMRRPPDTQQLNLRFPRDLVTWARGRAQAELAAGTLRRQGSQSPLLAWIIALMERERHWQAVEAQRRVAAEVCADDAGEA